MSWHNLGYSKYAASQVGPSYIGNLGQGVMDHIYTYKPEDPKHLVLH